MLIQSVGGGDCEFGAGCWRTSRTSRAATVRHAFKAAHQYTNQDLVYELSLNAKRDDDVLICGSSLIYGRSRVLIARRSSIAR